MRPGEEEPSRGASIDALRGLLVTPHARASFLIHACARVATRSWESRQHTRGPSEMVLYVGVVIVIVVIVGIVLIVVIVVIVVRGRNRRNRGRS